MPTALFVARFDLKIIFNSFNEKKARKLKGALRNLCFMNETTALGPFVYIHHTRPLPLYD